MRSFILNASFVQHHVSNTAINGREEAEEDECNVDTNEEENGAGAVNEGKSYYSTGSSPSREVQNILFADADNDEPCDSIQSKNDT